VVKESLVQLRRGGGTRELREAGRRASDGKSLSRPHRPEGRGGQEGGPVIRLRLLDCLEVGGPRRPCGGQDSSVETVTFRGAKGGVVGLPEHSQELRPPGFGSIGHPVLRGV